MLFRSEIYGQFHKRPSLLAISFLTFVGALGLGTAQGQQMPTPAPDNHDLGKWRDTPTDIRSQVDTTTVQDRRLRDAYWNGIMPPAPPGLGIARTPGLSSATGPEFPMIPNSVWVLCRFESSHVFETSGGGGLYTEINCRIDHVFGTPSPNFVREGELIDIGVPGGKIIDSNGHQRNRLSSGDLAHQLQPSHQYLLQLSHQASGNFFIPGKFWDLSDGTVRPVDPGDITRARNGKSSIAGTDARDLIPRLELLLSPKH
jgi:hypothetical protein